MFPITRHGPNIVCLLQDPTLFSGTIRSNLDPFGEHGDVRLWDALTKAQLKEAIEDMPDGLGTEVGDGGDMLSVGQRQLLCLARAVLRDSKVRGYLVECTKFLLGQSLYVLRRCGCVAVKVLVMDECTASVDVRTDTEIQKMIRRVFTGCISHGRHWQSSVTLLAGSSTPSNPWGENLSRLTVTVAVHDGQAARFSRSPTGSVLSSTTTASPC